MKILEDDYTVIIPYQFDKDSKKYYTKATIVSDESFKKIEIMMNTELMYGDVEYC